MVDVLAALDDMTPQLPKPLEGTFDPWGFYLRTPLAGKGITAKTEAHLWHFAPPVVATDINGDFETEFIVPAGLEPGVHALTVYMPYPSEGVFTAYTVAPGEAGR